MKNNTILSLTVKIFVFLIFVLLGLKSMRESFSEVPPVALRTPYGILEENGASLLYHMGNSAEPLLKFSPFDDYVYLATGEKQHVIDLQEAKKNKSFRSFSSNFRYHFNALTLKNPEFVWTAQASERREIYTARLEKGELTVKRRIILPGKVQITGYGNAVVICQECLVTDRYARVFYSGVYATNKKLSLALSKRFTPVFIPAQLPSDVSVVEVIKGEKSVFTLPVTQEVFFYEPFRVLEFTSPISSQNIKLNYEGIN